jgi:hypothetical protein
MIGRKGNVGISQSNQQRRARYRSARRRGRQSCPREGGAAQAPPAATTSWSMSSRTRLPASASPSERTCCARRFASFAQTPGRGGKLQPSYSFEEEILLVSDAEPMSKSLIIAIIASLVSTLVNAKPSTQRRTKAQPHSQIACTVLGCSPVPVGCVPRPGRTWSGLPSGFDVIVCPPGARPVR